VANNAPSESPGGEPVIEVVDGGLHHGWAVLTPNPALQTRVTVSGPGDLHAP